MLTFLSEKHVYLFARYMTFTYMYIVEGQTISSFGNNFWMWYWSFCFKSIYLLSVQSVEEGLHLMILVWYMIYGTFCLLCHCLGMTEVIYDLDLVTLTSSWQRKHCSIQLSDQDICTIMHQTKWLLNANVLRQDYCPWISVWMMYGYNVWQNKVTVYL